MVGIRAVGTAGNKPQDCICTRPVPAPAVVVVAWNCGGTWSAASSQQGQMQRQPEEHPRQSRTEQTKLLRVASDNLPDQGMFLGKADGCNPADELKTH